MKRISLLVAMGLGQLLSQLSSTSVTAGTAPPSVSLTAVSGFAGHAFVYAQVAGQGTVAPAPSGSGFLSPYYSVWKPFPIKLPGCPWIWAVYVMDRATGIQLNPPLPGAGVPNFQTSTLFCPGPGSTPVGVAPQDLARARLDLDLNVQVAPQTASTGTNRMVTALLAGSTHDDLQLYLSMAIKEWHIDHWTVDFGDGSQITLSGGASKQNLSLVHRYTAAGTYQPLVVATIAGSAQAAVIDAYGWPRLIQRRFTVEVGNRAQVDATNSLPSYVPPLVRLAVAPSLTGSGSQPGPTAFTSVDVLRGHLMDFALRPQTIREAELILNGAFSGFGHSRFVAWTYTGPPSAGGSESTVPGVQHRPSDPLRLQWDLPDSLSGELTLPYQVPVLLLFQSSFPNGHRINLSVPTLFSVTVDYAALSG